MTIGARVTYFADALQERMSTALVWLGDAIAFLSRTAWPLVDLLIRIWIGKSALVLSVLISTRLDDGRPHGGGLLSDPGPQPRVHSASEPGVLARRRLVDPWIGDSSRRRSAVGAYRRKPHPRGSARPQLVLDCVARLLRPAWRGSAVA